MGERNRVEWESSGLGDEASCHEYSVSAYNGGDWCVFTDGPHGDFGGTATDLASAKLAAEAALRARGLLGPEAETVRKVLPDGTVVCGRKGDKASYQGSDDPHEVRTITAEGPGPLTIATPDGRERSVRPGESFSWRPGAMTNNAALSHSVAVALRGARMIVAGVDDGAVAVRAPRRGAMGSVPVAPPSPAWLTIRGLFAGLAAAMATPQGRRVLAAQAVDAAVADGVRRGLDAEALRIVLVGALETIAGDVLPSYIVGDIARDMESGGQPGWACVAYRRALAARSAKPLGRPQKRRWTTRREW